MVLILLEALGALLLLVLIVWWTMFSGRKNGELPQSPSTSQTPDAAVGQPADTQAPGSRRKPPQQE